MSKTLPDLPPFRVPGSPDHINDHDLFDIWLAAVRDAFYPSPKYDFPAIPDPAVHGNPGHVEAHNRLRSCAEYMKATDYASDSSFPPIPAAADEGEQGHVVAHNEFRDVFAYVAAHQPSRYNAATGGSVTTVSNYNGTGQRWRVHTFTGSGTFTVQSADKPFRVLVVGGGGSGGSGNQVYAPGGGGGAGGLIEHRSQTLKAQAYPVTVGVGGPAVCKAPGYNGDPSSLGNVISVLGGGGGASHHGGPAGGRGGQGIVGSGGGGAGGSSGANVATDPLGGYGTPGQGNPGGSSNGSSEKGGCGGGGAGGPGQENVGRSDKHSDANGRGGYGIRTDITGAPIIYAGGGCGMLGTAPANGGGGGPVGINTNGKPGTDGLGGGGGANCGESGLGKFYSGKGGSGVVIIAYQIG